MTFHRLYKLPLIIFIPLKRKSELISLSITCMLLNIRDVAMPEPIRPPPITATFFTGLGLSPMSVTLGTCQSNESHVIAKNSNRKVSE